MRDLLRDAAERATRYLETLDDRPVAPRSEDVARLRERLDVPLPGDGLADRDMLAWLDDLGSPATVASAGGRFFGFVIGSALPASVAASWLTTTWDQNAVQSACAPGAALFEQAAGCSKRSRSSWRTTGEDVRRSTEAIVRAVRSVA